MNDQQTPDTNPIDLPIRLPSAEAIAKLRQTRIEIAEFNRELAEIEAQLDRELYAQKLARMGKIDLKS
jgi:hypothetical protein